MSRRAAITGILVALPALAAGCHGNHRGGAATPLPGSEPYVSARPVYAPPPVRPLFISGYAGRRPRVPPGRVVVPIAEPIAAPAGEPGLLP